MSVNREAEETKEVVRWFDDRVKQELLNR